jgi:hypothetical protein
MLLFVAATAMGLGCPCCRPAGSLAGVMLLLLLLPRFGAEPLQQLHPCSRQIMHDMHHLSCSKGCDSRQAMRLSVETVITCVQRLVTGTYGM